jgi:hypothetical protein
MDISLMVRRALDDSSDKGAQNEAMVARTLLRKKLIDDNEPIYCGKQTQTVDVMALMKIYNAPIVCENAKLKKEIASLQAHLERANNTNRRLLDALRKVLFDDKA